MKLFKKHWKKHFHEKLENIILLVGVILIALRLIFPVLQCRANIEDKIACPKGVVSFFSLTPDVKYQFHKERTVTQSIALGSLTLVGYIVAKSHRRRGLLG